MAPSAAVSPNKRRKLTPSPSKQAGLAAQPSLFAFFQNGSQNQQEDITSTTVVQDRPFAASTKTGPQSLTEKKTSECPLCAKRVPFSTIQAHVNTCLDAASASSADPVPKSEIIANNIDSIDAAIQPDRASSSCSPAPLSPAAPQSLASDVTSARNLAPKMTPISDLASSLNATASPTQSTSLPKPDSAAKSAGTGNFLTSARKAASSAFTVLMKSHSESKQWATADAVEAANYRGKARSRPEARTAPFYKALEGMPLTVDAFRFGKIEGCRGYFLTHFHSDHYGGMTANWNHGPIYCSVTTANLCRTHLGVDPQWLRPLPMEVAVPVPDSGGVTVTCIEANHCPGSCLFLFEGPQTSQLLSRNHASPYIGTGRIFRYLHCGDFRASPVHTNHPSIAGKKLDIIYLDTTYCNPRYCFPAQDQVIEACAELVRRVMPEEQLDCKALVKKQDEEEEEEEDWRQPPPRRARGGIDRDSSTATAFKGWFETKPGNPSPSTSDGALVKQEDADPESLSLKGEDDGLDYDEEDLFLGEESNDLDAEEPATARVKLEPSEEAVLDFDPVPNDTADGNRDTLETIQVKKEEPNTVSGNIGDTEAAAATSSNWLTKHAESKTECTSTGRRKGRLLVVIGTYTIGKERIVKAVARAMNSKIFCMDSRKYRVYQQLEDAELHSMLTRSPSACVHVTNLHAINGEGLRDVVAALRARGHDFTHAIAFRPTGWTYKPPAGMDTVSPSLDRLVQWNQSRSFGPQHLFPTRDSTPDYMIYGVPYSEHSSFFELTAFALSTRYDRIIATVNVGNPNSRAKMAKWFEKWAMEKRRRDKLGLDCLDARAVTYW